METIDLTFHIPTALGTAVVMLTIWLLYVVSRRKQPPEASVTDAKPKRRYTKKRSQPQEPVTE